MGKENALQKERGILDDIDQFGAFVKASLVSLIRDHLPALPTFDHFASGFSKAWSEYRSSTGKSIPEDSANQGIRLHRDSNGIVVINYEGVYRVPFAFSSTTGEIFPNWAQKEEVKPEEYVTIARTAIKAIKEWTDRYQQEKAQTS